MRPSVIFSRRVADMDRMAYCPTTPVSVLGRTVQVRGFWGRFVHWAAESRAHRVIVIVVAIWLLNAFDLALTLLSHEQGFLQEQNPVARHVLQFGAPSIILYKVLLVFIGSYPLLKFRAARITELGALVVALVYAVLAVRWSLCYEFYAVAFPSTMHNMAQVELSGSLFFP